MLERLLELCSPWSLSDINLSNTALTFFLHQLRITIDFSPRINNDHIIVAVSECGPPLPGCFGCQPDHGVCDCIWVKLSEQAHPSTCSASAQCLVLNLLRVLSVCSSLWKNICAHSAWECYRPCIHLHHATLMFLFLISLFLHMSLHLVDTTNFLSGLLLCFSHDRPRRSS